MRNSIEIQDSGFEDYYMNAVQMRANIVDPNVLVTEMGRATGKTEGVMGPRIIKVANAMPGELGFIVHNSYTALMTNVWPNIDAYFRRPMADGKRSKLEYGIDYIVGESKLPSHFKRPNYPVSFPKHSIIFRNGFNLQMVASDQPESVAGRSGVHAFIEEMKHQKGEKIKTRLFPSLRGSSEKIRQSCYYQGITGVSDTARVDLGEDNWFEDFEQNNNQELIDEIATVSLYVNKGIYDLYNIDMQYKKEKNPINMERLRLQRETVQRHLNLWKPRLNEMRRNSSYYIRASTFANKDILGQKFFKTQLDSMDIDDFLTAICAVRRKAVSSRFFVNYVPKIHQFIDGYKYSIILMMGLNDHFQVTAKYLNYYDSRDELIIGYDPGHFSSMIVAQEKKHGEELRVIKEFFCYYPYEQPELAKAFHDFFGHDSKNKRIRLFHDRAGNKKREDYEQAMTDARILKRELESYGFEVELQNEGQSTIYYWQQFKLLGLIFSGKYQSMPRVLIDQNECKNLCSAIMLSPRKKTDGRIELDKTSELKVPLKKQAGLTTQLPSALIYMLYGLYADRMPSELSNIPDDLPEGLNSF